MIPQRVARLFPPLHAWALRAAAELPRDQRPAEIDRITDQLAALGKCRPRDCTAMAERWALLRWRGLGA